MEPRFIVQSKYSKEESVRFNRAVLYDVWHFKRSIILTNVALMVMIVSSLIAGNHILAVTLLLAWAFVNWYFFVGVDMRAARVYNQNKLIQDKVFEFKFYDEHYEGSSTEGPTNVPYSKLHKIIDTPTNVYLMMAPSMGIIIQKENCPNGFLDFIQEVKTKHNL